MATITLPSVEEGDTLTAAITTSVISDVSTAVGSLTEDNLLENSVGRYQIDSADDGPIARYQYASEDSASTTYNNTTYAVIAHGTGSSEVTLSPSLTLSPGMVVRAHLFANIPSVSINTTYDDDDMYFFQLQLIKASGGATVVPGGEWGFSLMVRNDDGSLTSDSPAINTSTWDEKNYYKHRHVDICQVYVVPDGTIPYSISKLKWVVKLQDNHHSITIDNFAVAFTVLRA